MAPPTVTSKKYPPTYYPSHLDPSPPKQRNFREEHDTYSPPEQFNPVFDLLKWGYTGVAYCGAFCFAKLKSGFRTVFPLLQVELLIENPEKYLENFQLKPAECLLKLLDDFQARPDKVYFALKTFIDEYKKFPKKYTCLTCEDFSTKANDIFHKLVLEGVRFRLTNKKIIEGSIEGSDFYHNIVGQQPGQINDAAWQGMSSKSKVEITQFEKEIERFFHHYYSTELATSIVINADDRNKAKIGELIEGLIAEMIQKTKRASNQEAASLWFNLLRNICQFQHNFSEFPLIHYIINRLIQLLNDSIITQQGIELIIKEVKS